MEVVFVVKEMRVVADKLLLQFVRRIMKDHTPCLFDREMSGWMS